jgi:hypothetical protein
LQWKQLQPPQWRPTKEFLHRLVGHLYDANSVDADHCVVLVVEGGQHTRVAAASEGKVFKWEV